MKTPPAVCDPRRRLCPASCHPLRAGRRGSAAAHSAPGVWSRHSVSRSAIGISRAPRGWREVPGGCREVRPTATATPPQPDPGTRTAPHRPGTAPTAGTTCKARPEASATPGSGAPKLPQPDRPSAGSSLPRPFREQPAERRKHAFPQSLRYPFGSTPPRIDDPVTIPLLACMSGNLLCCPVTLWWQGL